MPAKRVYRYGVVAFATAFGAIAWIGLLALPASATAVRNSVSVSATTGENRGDAANGRAEVSASIETVVNGEVVEQFSERKASETGEPLSIEHRTTYETPSRTEDAARNTSAAQEKPFPAAGSPVEGIETVVTNSVPETTPLRAASRGGASAAIVSVSPPPRAAGEEPNAPFALDLSLVLLLASPLLFYVVKAFFAA